MIDTAELVWSPSKSFSTSVSFLQTDMGSGNLSGELLFIIVSDINILHVVIDGRLMVGRW